MPKQKDQKYEQLTGLDMRGDLTCHFTSARGDGLLGCNNTADCHVYLKNNKLLIHLRCIFLTLLCQKKQPNLCSNEL
ncbi:hypothetical protein INR49_012976 [Caranx melampygus]|nr:hypothetical protein INR49_012976 [Caranx melampygus]